MFIAPSTGKIIADAPFGVAEEGGIAIVVNVLLLGHQIPASFVQIVT